MSSFRSPFNKYNVSQRRDDAAGITGVVNVNDCWSGISTNSMSDLTGAFVLPSYPSAFLQTKEVA